MINLVNQFSNAGFVSLEHLNKSNRFHHQAQMKISNPRLRLLNNYILENIAMLNVLHFDVYRAEIWGRLRD